MAAVREFNYARVLRLAAGGDKRGLILKLRCKTPLQDDDYELFADYFDRKLKPILRKRGRQTKPPLQRKFERMQLAIAFDYYADIAKDEQKKRRRAEDIRADVADRFKLDRDYFEQEWQRASK